MAPPPDYEPSIAPAAFAAAWREKFRSEQRHGSSIYSLPDDDCPFDYDDQPLHNNAENVTENDVGRQRTESNEWVAGSPSLALSDLDNLQQHSPQVSIALAGTFMRQLDDQVQAMDEQIKQQDVWNNHMQQQMETIMERYQRLDALEEKVAGLQAKLDVVCGNKEGANEGRRSGGRRRQAP